MLAGILCCKMLLLSCLMMQDRGLTRGGSEEALATRNFRIQKRKEKDIYYYKLPPWPGLDSKSQRGICRKQVVLYDAKMLNDATELCIELKDAL
jgi:hypothetical protein